jgi:hypothetical protein
MTRSILATSLFAAIALQGCASQSVTSATRPVAIESAETRARYDLQCPDAKGTVVASKVIPPATAPKPLGGRDTYQHAEFSVGIAGCGEARTIPVTCSQEDSCFTGTPAP